MYCPQPLPRATSIHGFTLVELSIVLVIIGLLVGGVLTAQHLIRASQLRAVTTEYQTFEVAVSTFKDKYSAIPGDMSNATSFWAGGITSNGNGDGIPHNDVAVGDFCEMYMFWQHLALEKLINGTFTGRTGPKNNHDSVIGENTPISKMANATFSHDNIGYPSGSYNLPVYPYVVYGAVDAQDTAWNISNGPILKPEEAWSIDTKIDDGRPAKGEIVAGTWQDCTTSVDGNDFNGNYNLANQSKVCSLTFLKPFGIE